MSWLLSVLTLKEVADTHNHFLVVLINVLYFSPTQWELVTSPNSTLASLRKQNLALGPFECLQMLEGLRRLQPASSVSVLEKGVFTLIFLESRRTHERCVEIRGFKAVRAKEFSSAIGISRGHE